MTKEKKKQQPEIREGNDPDGINTESKDTSRESYPKLKIEDQQHKDQPEFIEKQPNKKDKE